MAATMKGMVRNGPTPTIEMMLVAVACNRPIPLRRSPGSQHRGHQPLGDILRRHERVQGEGIGELPAIARQCGIDRRSLVLLHRRDQLARVIGDRSDGVRLRAARIDPAWHLDDVVIIEERERAAVRNVERDDRALVLDDGADGDERDLVVAG